MKSLLLISTVVFSSLAAAHVEPGVYVGTTPDGASCQFTAVTMKFQNGLHHPLTERVVIEFAGETFEVGHPSAIDRTNAQVTFNHDLFQGLLPNANGAKAMIVEMIHSQTFEGPGAFEVIDHNWRTKSSTKLRCENIKLK